MTFHLIKWIWAGIIFIIRMLPCMNKRREDYGCMETKSSLRMLILLRGLEEDKGIISAQQK